MYTMPIFNFCRYRFIRNSVEVKLNDRVSEEFPSVFHTGHTILEALETRFLSVEIQETIIQKNEVNVTVNSNIKLDRFNIVTFTRNYNHNVIFIGSQNT